MRKGYTATYAAILFLLAVVLICKKFLFITGPHYEQLSRLLLMLATSGATPFLVDEVKDGAISLMPVTIYRNRSPIFFWVVVITQFALVISVSGFLLVALLT